jgi:hypothetical protein
MTSKIAKSWDELLNIGYVRELNECEVGEARHKLNPINPFKYRTPEEDLKFNNENERKMRKRCQKN